MSSPRSSSPSRQRGFALLITITLLAFLVLLLVSLASLTRVETQVAANSQTLSQARQNALFALNVALGQLQKTAGPDQRVTARAEVDSTAVLTNRRWTGVWDSDPVSATFGQRLAWLVSGPTPAATTAVADPGATGVSTTAVRLVGSNSADLSDSAASDANRIDVSTQEIRTDSVAGLATTPGGHLVGRYAWWVGDEGVKSRANLPNPHRQPWNATAPDIAEQLNDIGTAQRNAIEWMQAKATGSDLLNPLLPASASLLFERWSSSRQLSLSAANAADAATLATSGKIRFHDLSFWSAGVQSDVRQGGLKRDLTAAFEMDDTAFQVSSFANAAPATTRIPMAPTASAQSISPIYVFDRDSTGAALPNAGKFYGPSWHLFRNHYRFYKEASTAPSNLAGTPVFRARTFLPNESLGQPVANRLPVADTYLDVHNKVFTAGGTDYDPKTTATRPDGSQIPRPTSPSLMPYINRVSYILSLQTVLVPTPATAVPPPTDSAIYEVRIIFTPYIVLHNPYNVRVSLDNLGSPVTAPTGTTGPGGAWARIELNGLPFSQLIKAVTPSSATVQFKRSSTSATETELEKRATPLLIAAMNANTNMSYQNFADLYIPANITLEPGQLRVFSPDAGVTSQIAQKILLAPNKNIQGGYYFNQLNGGYNGGASGTDTYFSTWSAATIGADKATPNPIGPGYGPVVPAANDYRVLVTGNTSLYLALADSTLGNDRRVIIRHYPASYAGDRSNADNRMPLHSELYVNNVRIATAGAPLTRAKDYATYSAWVNATPDNSFNGGDLAVNYSGSVPTPLFAFDVYVKPADQPAARASRTFTQNNPLAVVSAKEPEGAYTAQGSKTGYPMGPDAWQPEYRRLSGGINSWTTDTLEADPVTGEAYWGPSHFGGSGLNRVSLIEVPVRPLTSLAQFQHLMISMYSNQPYFAVGNSEATAYINPAQKLSDVSKFKNSTTNTPWIMGDISYLANEALWDSCFFSTLAPGFNGTTNSYYVPAVGAPSPDANPNSRDSVLTAWLAGTRSLPNSRIHSYRSPTRSEADHKAALLNPDRAAGELLLAGSFNVNSRSVEAWTAVLAGARNAAMLTPNASTAVTLTDGLAVPRTVPSVAGERASTPAGTWNGYARLSDTQVRTLATRLVSEITQRQIANGNRPFLSLAEFINRALVDSTLGRKGALQAAIDDAGLNTVIAVQDITTALQTAADFPFPDNGAGNTVSAASGNIRQADLLQQIGPSLSARSDTFLIRTYGETINPVTATSQGRAWCEAVVQRVPDYVDTVANQPHEIPAAATPNATFGRRFKVISFRWLTPDDI